MIDPTPTANTVFEWFNKYQAVAIWLEGIALILIFIWDRIDARDAQEESNKHLLVFQEQAEASQKPVVVLICVARSDESGQVMERLAQKHVPQAGRLATVPTTGNFIIKNIGTGPALNLSFDFAPIELKPDTDDSDPRRYARRFPYLVPRDEFVAPISPANVMVFDYKFTAYYESLSGKKYLTEMVLHGRSEVTVVLRDDWIFKTL
jgi:hypothetical protein